MKLFLLVYPLCLPHPPPPSHPLNALFHSLSRLQHDLDDLKEKCTRLEAQMLLKASEVDHLKRANEQAQEEVAHLKKVSTQLHFSWFPLSSLSLR